MKSVYKAFLVGSWAVTTSFAQPAAPDGQLIHPSTFTVPGAFPTSVYSNYYNNPTATSAQVQPVISDPVTNKIYPLSLTGPDSLPLNNTVDPHPLPPKASSSRLYSQALLQIKNIAANPTFNTTCAKCQASLEVAKFLALAAPEEVPGLAVELCEFFGFSSTCGTTYSILGIGSVITQVISNADAAGYDGQMLCQNFLGQCPLPPTSPLNLTNWFAKPKPDPLPEPRKPSGKRLKVLHVSDLHIDPRYATGSEANCTSGLCCRGDHFNSASPNASLFPAPRFGTYRCDTPFALVMAALQAIPPLTGTQDTGFAWSMYTGDMVSHDQDNQLSRAQDAPHSLGPPLADQFSWNYDHVAALWKHEDWLPEAAVQTAKAHYACYSVKRFDGFRVLSLNTDLWYRANYFNYINMTDPDVSGMLRFLTDELQEAEDEGDRVWIIGHVLTGWDGSNPLMNPTNLFYQIVDRFSPHVIANIFFGHTHEDQMSIFYANNATNISAGTAQALAWIGPSLTPITNLNSGFRVYEVDSNTFDIVDAHTWFSDVNTFTSLDSQLDIGPIYNYEYNTREAYGKNISGWGPSDPLNATWWHHVTEAMEADNSLVTTFNRFQGKSSVKSPNCTGDCIAAKICYIRSGSASIAKQNCQQGFGSVQGG
ncbi:hypothetical protein VNI00_002222 [Paramarasmius palmivorus]|uniref:Sphingomyelin phosphodiesterase n=1 Tax=Paramarasmius palmivorus TaxID=297713 RepID=A0AAW0E0G0_9AGAR